MSQQIIETENLPAVPAEENLSNDTMKCVLLVFKALSRSMMSPTVWELALLYAQREAERIGIENSEEHIEKIKGVIRSQRSRFTNEFMGEL